MAWTDLLDLYQQLGGLSRGRLPDIQQTGEDIGGMALDNPTMRRVMDYGTYMFGVPGAGATIPALRALSMKMGTTPGHVIGGMLPYANPYSAAATTAQQAYPAVKQAFQNPTAGNISSAAIQSAIPATALAGGLLSGVARTGARALTTEEKLAGMGYSSTNPFVRPPGSNIDYYIPPSNPTRVGDLARTMGGVQPEDIAEAARLKKAGRLNYMPPLAAGATATAGDQKTDDSGYESYDDIPIGRKIGAYLEQDVNDLGGAVRDFGGRLGVGSSNIRSQQAESARTAMGGLLSQGYSNVTNPSWWGRVGRVAGQTASDMSGLTAFQDAARTYASGGGPGDISPEIMTGLMAPAFLRPFPGMTPPPPIARAAAPAPAPLPTGPVPQPLAGAANALSQAGTANAPNLSSGLLSNAPTRFASGLTRGGSVPTGPFEMPARMPSSMKVTDGWVHQGSQMVHDETGRFVRAATDDELGQLNTPQPAPRLPGLLKGGRYPLQIAAPSAAVDQLDNFMQPKDQTRLPDTNVDFDRDVMPNVDFSYDPDRFSGRR